MPNHVTNIVRFEGPPKAVAALREAIVGEPWEDGTARLIDFEAIVPGEPEGVPMIHDGEVVGTSMTRDHVGWCCDNWGTKWNAYSQKEVEDGILFETAWSYPEPVMVALSKQHPDVTLLIEWADEDISHNLGAVCLRAGEEVNLAVEHAEDKAEEAIARLKGIYKAPEEGTAEARAFAYRVKGYSAEYIAEMEAEREAYEDEE